MAEEVRPPVLTLGKLSPAAVAPVPWPPGNRFSNSVRFSAYDIAIAEDTLVQPNTMADLSTGLAMTLSEGSRMFTAPRFAERLPDGVGPLPREIESYEFCDVPIVFWNRSPNSYVGTLNFWLILLFAIYFYLFSLVKAGDPICALVLDLGGAYACSCAAEPVPLVEFKL